MRKWAVALAFIMLLSGSLACGVSSRAYRLTKGTVRTTYGITKGTAKLALGTGEIVYNVGCYTFKVVRAPMSWPLMHDEIETVDGLSPKEAIRQGRVKNAPYTVMGKTYYPMSLDEAAQYREVGVASWYGKETLRNRGGHMTANGEAFSPRKLSAAHKYLPLPTFVRVTNLENRCSIIVRVNDRGPFVAGRIIDLSAAAAHKLGFYDQGTARVLVQTVHTD
jgi:rare lipoprotein A